MPCRSGNFHPEPDRIRNGSPQNHSAPVGLDRHNIRDGDAKKESPSSCLPILASVLLVKIDYSRISAPTALAVRTSRRGLHRPRQRASRLVFSCGTKRHSVTFDLVPPSVCLSVSADRRHAARKYTPCRAQSHDAASADFSPPFPKNSTRERTIFRPLGQFQKKRAYSNLFLQI